MKKNYFKFLFLGSLAFSMKANAQCSSCTTTISGVDAASHIVSSGQTLCITASGTASGLISVSTGGTLCNQGHITSPNVWIAGGTLYNYGTINTHNILVSAQGIYNNYVGSTVTMDSLLVTNLNSSLVNAGSINGLRLGNSDNSSIINNGDIKVHFLGDSTASFTNNHNITVDTSFYNAYSSTFLNHGYMKIAYDFFNSTSATFETNCMIPVGRDWYNASPGTVTGPPTGSCGGFSITGVSANSGTIGNSSTHIDLCDAGHPAGGIDGPGGTIASTTTYCSCTNICIALMGINEQTMESNVLIQNVYPNPTNSDLTIEIYCSEGVPSGQIEVIDMMGRKQISNLFRSVIGDYKTTLDVSKLAQGTYVLSITDSKQLQSKKLFTVVK